VPATANGSIVTATGALTESALNRSHSTGPASGFRSASPWGASNRSTAAGRSARTSIATSTPREARSFAGAAGDGSSAQAGAADRTARTAASTAAARTQRSRSRNATVPDASTAAASVRAATLDVPSTNSQPASAIRLGSG
jgi:hypothetical protein